MSDLTISKTEMGLLNVAIATPTYDHAVTTEYVASLWKTTKYFDHIGLRLNLLMSDGASIEKARNFLVARFLEDPTLTHLLFIDGDQGWEPNDILRLLAYKKPFLGAAIRKKVITEAKWAVNFIPNSAVNDDGLLPVQELGTGFVLLERQVLERMIDAHPNLKIKVDDGSLYKGPLYMLFHFELDEDGTYWSEDLNFCRRWRRMGGEIFIDPSLELSHLGRHDFRDCFGNYLTLEE